MPTGPLDFRASCGQFAFVYSAFMAKRERLAIKMRCRVVNVRTKMEAVMVGLVLTIFLTNDLLLRAGNVETNPGPNGKELDGEEKGLMERRKDQARTVQTRLTANTRSGSSSTDRRNNVNSPPPEPTLGDLMAKLTSMESSMNSKLDQVREDFQRVKTEVAGMQKAVQQWKERVAVLEKENQEMKSVNQELLDRVLKVERHADDLEGRSRRNNLLFHGLEREEGETPRGLELRLKDLFTDKLDIAQDIVMDRVHRLGSMSNAPVIARCCFYKDKVTILKAKQKLKGTNFFIGEDFSKGVRETRKKLSLILKDMRQKDKNLKATLVHDHIVMDGKKFFLAADGQSVREEK